MNPALNDRFMFDDNSSVIIKGYKGSAAERYAKKWGIRFQAIG